MLSAINKEKFIYPSSEALENIQKKLSSFPALIRHNEVDALINQFEKTYCRENFIIHAGDCAERFSDAASHITHEKCNMLLMLKALLENELNLPVVPIGRIAGQYAKPRSKPIVKINGENIYAYHGDLINAEVSSTPESREPNPNRILQAYANSKRVLSHMNELNEFIYTSHECFLLEYEQPLTRLKQGKKYNLSTHLLWLGMRNIKSEQHISYLADVANPIGLKVGPTVSPKTVVSVVRRLNPENRIGKIILITRLGSDKTVSTLPYFISAISKNKLNVLWMCDPLHGNTQADQYNKKFRLMSHIAEETILTSKMLHQHGCHLSGLHLEATHREDVLECVSSLNQLSAERCYESALDPRLNKKQSLYYLRHVSSHICL